LSVFTPTHKNPKTKTATNRRSLKRTILPLDYQPSSRAGHIDTSRRDRCPVPHPFRVFCEMDGTSQLSQRQKRQPACANCLSYTQKSFACSPEPKAPGAIR
jgi:hypothetical protein